MSVIKDPSDLRKGREPIKTVCLVLHFSIIKHIMVTSTQTVLKSVLRIKYYVTIHLQLERCNCMVLRWQILVLNVQKNHTNRKKNSDLSEVPYQIQVQNRRTQFYTVGENKSQTCKSHHLFSDHTTESQITSNVADTTTKSRNRYN